MIICAVDYGDPHIFASKLFRRLKAAKSGADYDNMRFLILRFLHLREFQERSTPK
jgi:hypothetical protein